MRKTYTRWKIEKETDEFDQAIARQRNMAFTIWSETIPNTSYLLFVDADEKKSPSSSIVEFFYETQNYGLSCEPHSIR